MPFALVLCDGPVSAGLTGRRQVGYVKEALLFRGYARAIRSR